VRSHRLQQPIQSDLLQHTFHKNCGVKLASQHVIFSKQPQLSWRRCSSISCGGSVLHCIMLITASNGCEALPYAGLQIPLDEAHLFVRSCMLSCRSGKLVLVDLAGSERLKDTGNNGKEAVRETGSINKSLFTLGQVRSSRQVSLNKSPCPLLSFRSLQVDHE